MRNASAVVPQPLLRPRVRWMPGARELGYVVKAELWIAPHDGAPVEHVHPHSEERLEVLSGNLTLAMDGERPRLRGGQLVTIPAGVPHAWHNEEDEVAHLIAELDPGVRLSDTIDCLARLDAQAEATGRAPHVLPRLLALRSLDEETGAPGDPVWVARGPFATRRSLV